MCFHRGCHWHHCPFQLAAAAAGIVTAVGSFVGLVAVERRAVVLVTELRVLEAKQEVRVSYTAVETAETIDWCGGGRVDPVATGSRRDALKVAATV